MITTPLPCALRRTAAVCLLAAGGFGTPTAVAGQATPTTGPPLASVTTVATGLADPRGIAFDAAGVLLVAVVGPAGANAGVVAIDGGCPRPLVEGLPNAGVAFGRAGVADVAVLGSATYLLLAGGDIGRGAPNGLYRIDDAGGTTLVADVSAFIRDNPVAQVPGDHNVNGQPYALMPTLAGDAFWMTEGNSNQVLRLGLDGTVTRIADLSAGHPIPTGIAPAPGGGAYVALFTHAPYEPGAGRVVEVAPDGAVTEVWTGLTLPTALATGPDGALYALEMATGIDANDSASIAPGTGRLVRRTGPTTAEAVVTGLTYPVAMEFGPDGALFVAGPAFGSDGGTGTILRVDLAAASGQPLVAPPDADTAPAVCP